MRVGFFVFAFFVASNTHAQTAREILDSGKKEFRYQFNQYPPDYTNSLQLLRKAVAMDSSNAEARYFLGYCLDKVNMLHGMDSVNRDMCFEVSKELEAVNRLQSPYTGEIMLLDPYSKITANWGSLAMHYLAESKIDSAKWAFRTGKQKGAFNDGLLDYNRQVLNSCDKNSILILSGDNVTFPCYYLQLIENFRQDLVIIDKFLLGTNWYPQYLRNSRVVKFGFSSTELDTINYLKWDTEEMTLTPLGSTQSIKWELKPTYAGYLLRDDRLLLDILQHNLTEDHLYFTGSTDSTLDIWLKAHLSFEGEVCQLRTYQVDYLAQQVPYTTVSTYTSANVSKEEITRSKDVTQCYNNLRLRNIQAVYILLQQNKKKEATELFNDMLKRFPLEKVHFNNPDIEQYFNLVKEMLN